MHTYINTAVFFLPEKNWISLRSPKKKQNRINWYALESMLMLLLAAIMDSLTRNTLIHTPYPKNSIKRTRKEIFQSDELRDTLAWFEEAVNEARNAGGTSDQLAKITCLKPQSLTCCIYVSKILDLSLDLDQVATLNLSSSTSLLLDSISSITRQLTGTSSPYLDHLNKWHQQGNIHIVINNIEAYGAKTLEKLLRLGIARLFIKML
jgi:hypothetical protein